VLLTWSVHAKFPIQQFVLVKYHFQHRYFLIFFTVYSTVILLVIWHYMALHGNVEIGNKATKKERIESRRKTEQKQIDKNVFGFSGKLQFFSIAASQSRIQDGGNSGATVAGVCVTPHNLDIFVTFILFALLWLKCYYKTIGNHFHGYF
jgi:hypothetical protein